MSYWGSRILIGRSGYRLGVKKTDMVFREESGFYLVKNNMHSVPACALKSTVEC